MKYRTIGQTGISVSEIGFGCGNNAVLMVRASYEEQVKAVRHALDLGINYFDTAFAYGLGKSEQNLGRILNELKPRAIVSTKIRLEAGGLRDIKSAAIKAIEDALQRLQLERVDFIQLHTRVTTQRGMGKRFSLTPEDVLGSNGVIDGFKAMQERNKVGFFGFSGLGDPQALHQLVDSGRFHAFQVYYNLLNPTAGYRVSPGFSALDYRLILDRAAAKGMGSFVIRVLAAGALTAEPDAGGGSSPEPLSPGSDYAFDLARAEKIKRVLNIEAKQLPQAAIRFALMNPKVSTVLVGFSNPTHIDEAVACSGAPPLSDTQMSELEKLWQNDFGKAEKA